MARASTAGHFTDLDGMRGILACTVMLFHLGLNSLVARLTHGLVPTGAWTLCVDFFFILSGFVLYRSLEKTRPSLKRYFIKRLRRLAPMFWIGTLIMLVLITRHLSFKVIAANLLIVQSLFKGLSPRLWTMSLDLPGWSVPFELFLPALILPLLPWLGRLGRRATIGLVVTLLILAGTFAITLVLGRDIPLARAAFGLGLGMALSRLSQVIPETHPRPLLVLSLFTLAIAVMALSMRLPPLAALFPLLSICCVFFGARTSTFLSSAPFQAIGRWSYSIYLLHIPTLALVGRTLGHVEGNVALKLVVIVATIAASAVMYRFVEEPLMQGPERPAETAP
jgi:peptidoglycan/LPS O-acetylase OafA/YrhL